MTQTLSRRRVVAALAGLPLVGFARPASAAAPDFALDLIRWPTGGERWELVRGGGWGPQFRAFYYGCMHTTTEIYVVSRNGFSGTVTLEMLNLPPGVTSQTATSIFLPARSARGTRFSLTAASNAPLGPVTVTIRATSGGIVHTRSEVIWIVDALTPCD